MDRLHLAHLNEAEGLRIPDPEQQYYVLDPEDARMRQRDPLLRIATGRTAPC